jgi:hypothetical protein
MLHRLKPSILDPQSVPFVSAVVAAEPIKKRIWTDRKEVSFGIRGGMGMGERTNEIVKGIQCARIPNKMLVARNKNPKSKYTFKPHKS